MTSESNAIHHFVTPWRQIAILVAVGFVCYFNSLNCPFIFDDQSNILRNETIHSLWNPQGRLPVYLHHRPVCRWTLALNYAMGGLNVRGYHLANILIHVAAAMVLFLLVRDTLRLNSTWKALGCDTANKTSGSENLAFAVALFWLVHPLQTESVTYISQRLESLMGLFFLLTMYCLLRTSQAARAWPWGLATIGSFSLGIASKEVTAMAFLVALLFDRIFLEQSWKDVFKKRFVLYLGFLPSLVWLGWELATFKPDSQDAGLYYEGVTRWDYLSTQPEVLLHYLKLVFWPNVLCVDYGWPVAKDAASIYGLGAVVLALLLTSFALLRYSPRIGFLGVSFFLILAPTSSFVPIKDLAFEHRMYLPLALVVIFTVLVIDRGWRSSSPLHDDWQNVLRRRCLMALLVIVTIALAARTITRNSDYKTVLSIWTVTANQRPDNVRAQYNGGLALVVENRDDEGLKYLQRAIQLDPTYFRAWHYLGVCNEKLRKYDEALKDFDQALALNSNYANTYLRRGELFLKQKRYQEAINDLTQFISFEPLHPRAHLFRGIAQREIGNYEDALQDLNRIPPSAIENKRAIDERETTLRRQASSAPPASPATSRDAKE